VKPNTTIEVLNGSARWGADCADAIAWLESLPDDSVDLLFTSPPYMGARTYGIGFDMDAEEWTAWMVRVVRAATPKVKGLIAINCEGQTRDYAYQPAPFLLAADLYRAGFNLRKPPVFHRVGIPGSGGPDWLRNDYEPVICVTRSGRLPWSENTACGHPPKWGPGGEMSYRLSSGTRINQWGKTGSKTGTTATGNKEKPTIGKPRPSHATMTKEGRRVTKQKEGMHGGQDNTIYSEPVLANPGNVLSLVVGGGAMGHPAAHDNEAPFPVELPTFFIRSFCPPDTGVVADCFLGSGTTIDAAVQCGRRGIGCDVRQSQIDLVRRRMATVTPGIFAS
jgi:hypothetical protein